MALTNALERLRNTVYEWGPAGEPDQGYMDQFIEQVNDDLNMPRALAVTWDLARSDLDAATKKGTILFFDRILGLRLDQWQPTQETIPAEVLALVQLRQQARQREALGGCRCISPAGEAKQDTRSRIRLRAPG